MLDNDEYINQYYMYYYYSLLKQLPSFVFTMVVQPEKQLCYNFVGIQSLFS